MTVTSIDTIKFHYQYKSTSNIIKHWLKLDSVEGYTIDTTTYNTLKVRKGNQPFFLQIKKDVHNNYTHLNITIHLNRFIYNHFQTNEVDIGNALYKLDRIFEQVTGKTFTRNRYISIREVHIAKDIITDYNPNYYLRLIGFLTMSYHLTFLSSGSFTITYHPRKEIDSLDFESKKPDKNAVIYDKSRKFTFKNINIENNILRFEYIFKGNQRLKIGIKQTETTLFNVVDMEWEKLFQKYFIERLFGEYLEINLNQIKTPSHERLLNNYDIQKDKISFQMSSSTYKKDYDLGKVGLLFSQTENDIRRQKYKEEMKSKLQLIELMDKPIPEVEGVRGIDLMEELIEKIKIKNSVNGIRNTMKVIIADNSPVEVD